MKSTRTQVQIDRVEEREREREQAKRKRKIESGEPGQEDQETMTQRQQFVVRAQKLYLASHNFSF